MKLQTRQETANTVVHENLHPQYEDKPLITDNQTVSKGFWFLSRSYNKEYDEGLKTVPLRSCLLHHKAAVFQWHIKTKPKWFTDLLQTNFSRDTGEILGQEVYRTDDLTAGNNRKIKALNRFCSHFEPLYRQRSISLWFYTFTLANQAKVSIRDCFDAFQKRLKRRNIKLHGYIWILEISDDLHVHYHALVATDRINFKGKGLPNYLKLYGVWGARTQVQYVTHSLKFYLSKYFTKNKSRIIGKRQYGLKMPKK